MRHTDFAVRKRSSILNGTTTSSLPIDFRRYSYGTLYWPAAFDGATVSFTVSQTETGTYAALVDSTGTAVTMTKAVGKAAPLPVELAGVSFFKIVSASNETADRSILLDCKP